jgi:hypothetical protein
MSDLNALSFVESAELPPPPGRIEGLEAAPVLNLDRLPAGVVSGNTLIDFSETPAVGVRAGVSMALLFASRVAEANALLAMPRVQKLPGELRDRPAPPELRPVCCRAAAEVVI